jgi:hypothetical protein
MLDDLQISRSPLHAEHLVHLATSLRIAMYGWLYLERCQTTHGSSIVTVVARSLLLPRPRQTGRQLMYPHDAVFISFGGNLESDFTNPGTQETAVCHIKDDASAVKSLPPR